MDEPTLRGDLLDEVEFVPIPGQNRNSRLRGSQEDQRIVQAFLALVRLEALPGSFRWREAQKSFASFLQKRRFCLRHLPLAQGRYHLQADFRALCDAGVWKP